MASCKRMRCLSAACGCVGIVLWAGAAPLLAADPPGIAEGFGLREQFGKDGGYERHGLNDLKAEVIDVNVQQPVVLPFTGPGVKQVSGIRVKVDAAGRFEAPGEVCTLIFQGQGRHAVVRVWENKDHRYFVSLTGDDGGPGTEARPFRTIQHGIDTLLKKDPRGDLYVAGGDYVQKEDAVVMRGEVSLYGGFDQAGWRRDPIIHEPVLLPHGFRENWVDDMCERFKDLRRPDHRYHETRIHRLRFTGKNRAATLCDGLHSGGGAGDNVGSEKTYIDGLAVFGCPHWDDVSQPAVIASSGRRSMRNLILVPIYSNTRAPTLAGGSGLVENCIVWGGYVGFANNARHQTLLSSSSLFRRNLIVGGIGSHYHRMIHNWYGISRLHENQIHVGQSFGGPDRVVVVNTGTALWYEQDHVWTGNLIFTEHLTTQLSCPGIIFKNNTVYLRKKGFSELAIARTLTITDNTFHYFPPATKDDVLDPDVPNLGGTWDFKGKHKWDDQGSAKYVPPAPGQGTKPTIENNRLVQVEPFDIRLWCPTDVRRLAEAVRKHGEQAAVRPKDPPTRLEAAPAGGGKVRLTWEKSPDPSIVGYRVRYGPRPNSYANDQAVGNVATTTIEGLKAGRCYFTVAAHKEGFVECWTLSNEAAADIK